MRLERFKIKGWQNDKCLLTCWLRSPFQFLIRQQLVRKSSIRNERSTVDPPFLVTSWKNRSALNGAWVKEQAVLPCLGLPKP